MRIKSLYESLLDDFDAIANKVDARQQVLDFLEEHCDMSLPDIKVSAKPNKDGFYEVSSNGSVWIGGHSEALTNGLFIWTKVKRDFFCDSMGLLKTLKGGPKEVGGSFVCNGCGSLTSLEGAPKKCKMFSCSWCRNLHSLEGGPVEVEGGYDCSQCDLKNLKGAPKKVGGHFDCGKNIHLTSIEDAPETCERGFSCSGCKSLKSLKGLPKHVSRGTVRVSACGTKFNIKDIDWYPSEVCVTNW